MTARRISRRHVLAAMAAVPVAATIGTGAVAYSWWDRPADAPLKALSADEHAFVQALGEAWMPRGGTPELSGADARLGDWMDELLAGMPPQTRKELKILLHLLDNLPVPTRLGRFQALDRETRSQVLEAWLDHPVFLVRDAAAAVMVLLGVGWTTHPEVVGLLRPMFRCGYGR